MQTFFDGILASISRFDLIDALDILLVAVMIYYLLKLASRSRAMQVLKGIGLVFIASRLTELFRLQAVTWIFNYLINAGALVLIVLFQPEIRRGLEQIGRGKFLDSLQNHEGMETSGELIRAMLNMSKQHVGALIAIQRKVALGDIIETGTQINGRVSAPLIETIFKTGTALHDGAMIIDGDTILAASCFLPLTSRQDLPQELGTRHRAGIGLSEISDAVVFIVSEETGQISAVVEGRLIRNLSAGGIRRLLFGGDENKDGTERNRIFAKMKNRRKKSQ
ncbi:MAG: diadenylate cyclase CdaA [Clostridiales bacterium]|nr:diadenylate cyclase CdaA [Clostridiales bacterium]